MTRRLRLALSLLPALAAVGAAGPASAQIVLPGAQLPFQPGEAAAPNPGARDPGVAPAAPAPPPAPKPAAVKAPTEESLLQRPLRLNGATGSLRVERASRTELKARLTLLGTRISNPTEACEVTIEAPLPLSPKGRPEGLPRYEIAAPSCLIAGDLLDGALWVRGPAEACRVEAADCRVDPRGLWGPEPAPLAALARAIEQSRGAADRAVRENYKVLAQRAKAQDVRGIVAEQAAFSAEREMLCRSYAREASHGFCNARFTEARAAQLAARLGLTPSPASPAAAAPRRPPAPQPAAPQPAAPMSLLPN